MDEIRIQIGASQGQVWIWNKSSLGTAVILYIRMDLKDYMRYGKLSKLIILSAKEGPGKFNAKEYLNEILNGESFDF
jgi:hypothetical protein